MNSLIPPFDFHQVCLAPWTEQFGSTIWIVLMGFLVTAACGLVGNYLILRRMALVGDAISHSVLPGIALAFLLSNSRGTIPMFLGALVAGIVATLIIEVIHKKSRVKQDSAIGIAFTSLFAIGVILISLYASKVDLDQECVLYGEIAFVPLAPMVELGGMAIAPQPVFRMAVVAIIVILLIVIFYKELLVSSFDPALAFSVGINATVIHYSLMCVLSAVVVSAFESVGAILVIAMLILPGATASMLWHRLPGILCLTVLFSALSSVLGFHLATWLNCSIAAAMVVMAAFCFVLAWLFSPTQGMLRRWKRKPLEEPLPEPALNPPKL
ncbi:MAG: metal ABC transporter permease [Akkermansiaceae bacterium]|nr:metal ABC transporter permease [Verrucomicrobiales bacterium]